MQLSKLAFLAISITMTGYLAVAQPSATAPLLIEVNGIRSAEGAIVVAIFDQEQAFEAVDINASVAVSFLPATARSIQITLHSLPDGAYAVAAIHDENIDGELNFDGDVPIEGYAFAAMGQSGLRPRFEDALVAAGPDAIATLNLRYWR